MQQVIKISIILLIVLSCKEKNIEFFNVEYFEEKLSNNFNIQLDKSIKTIHTLSDSELDSIGLNIDMASDYTILSNLFYDDLEPQISSSGITVIEISKYLNESFSKSTLKTLYERDQINKKDFDAIVYFIDFLADDLYGAPIYQVRMFQLNIHYMKEKGVLSDSEYRELTLVNYLTLIADHKNG